MACLAPRRGQPAYRKVESPRNFGGDADRLQSHVAFDETGYVNVAVAVAVEQIAIPEVWVCVQVGDEELLVENGRFLSYRLLLLLLHPVEQPVNERRHQMRQREACAEQNDECKNHAVYGFCHTCFQP